MDEVRCILREVVARHSKDRSAEGKEDKAAARCVAIPMQQGEYEVKHCFDGDRPSACDDAIDGIGPGAIEEEKSQKNIQVPKVSYFGEARREGLEQQVDDDDEIEKRGDPEEAANEIVREWIALASLAIEREVQGEGADQIEQLHTALPGVANYPTLAGPLLGDDRRMDEHNAEDGEPTQRLQMTQIFVGGLGGVDSLFMLGDESRFSLESIRGEFDCPVPMGWRRKHFCLYLRV